MYEYGALQLSGIPCKHAMASISYIRIIPIAYVLASLTKTAYLQTYASMIHPIPVESAWPEVNVNRCNLQIKKESLVS